MDWCWMGVFLQLRDREKLLWVQVCLNTDHISNMTKQVLAGRKLQSSWQTTSFKTGEKTPLIPLTCTDQNVFPSYLLPLETADAAVISVMPNGLFIRTSLNGFGKERNKKVMAFPQTATKGGRMCSPKKRNFTPTSALFRLTGETKSAWWCKPAASFVTKAVVSQTNQDHFLFLAQIYVSLRFVQTLERREVES